MKYIYIFFMLLLITSCTSDTSVVEPPVAVNDLGSTIENTVITISVLENDELNNQATIFNYDSESENNGTIVARLNNSFVYTPPTNFIGSDTFSYTICDALSTPSCSTATVTITVSDEGTAVAVDNEFEVVENSILEITTLLDNDTLLDGAALENINTDSTNGTVVLNEDKTVNYTAINGFVGEDTFTYTICDNDDTPTCSTATVTITVTDEGSPTVNNDVFYISENETSIDLDVLSNDNLVDDAEISSINNTSAQGIITLNSDGTIKYTTQSGFSGTDTFFYTICDDDTPTAECATATVTVTILDSIGFNIPATLDYYYGNLQFTDNAEVNYTLLKEHTVVNHTTILSYSQRHTYLYNADADLANTDNVTLMYSGESRYWEEYTSGTNAYSTQTYNTEHIYPQSKLVSEDAVTDLHHLRSCDAIVNEDRSNFPYTSGSGTYSLSNEQWYPGDDWRGDVARMVMYINVRYQESFSKVGTLELFLEWNALDPVSPFEQQRNTVIEGAQGNRNPFIDNPYLATLLWGGNDAENKWE